MIAEYLTRRDAEIYASELIQLYGPDVHFDVVDPVSVTPRHWHPADERLDDYLGGSTRAMLRKEERAARARRHC